MTHPLVAILVTCALLGASSGVRREPRAGAPRVHARRASKQKPAREPVRPPVLREEPLVDELAAARVVKENKAAIGLCYQRILKYEPSLKVPKMITRLDIESTGRVVDVTFGGAHPADDDMGQCLAQAIKQWTFPTATGQYHFEFPIILSTD